MIVSPGEEVSDRNEDDGAEGNRIPTIFVGPMVRKGVYSQRIDHYTVLRTILEMYALPLLNKSANAPPIDFIWTRTATAARPKVIPRARKL